MIKSSQRPLRTRPPMENVRLDPDGQRELGEGGMGLTGLAVAEATNKLKPEERAELLKTLVEQHSFLRSIEVD